MKSFFQTENRKAEKAIKAKKHLGQHFLKDENIAISIVKSLIESCNTNMVLEIGPGMGVLTKYLLQQNQFTTYAIDVDGESIAYLALHFPELGERLIEGDFLQLDMKEVFNEPFSLIGNFPYNISSQIVFKILENKHQIPLMVGMFQKEVAERFCARTHSKAYGILSVLTQAFYDAEYLFTVDENVFVPSPKVKSAVIRLKRKEKDPDVDEKRFFKVVKTAFNQRRKKLRNALKQFNVSDEILQPSGFSDKRAEELSVEEFINLTNLITSHGENV